MHLTALLLTLHLLAATFWVGGMAAFQFAVRPAAVVALDPPQRLLFMVAALTRFLNAVALAIGVLLASGLALVFLQGGFSAVHWSVHAMFSVALAMVGIYAFIRARLLARLQQAVAAKDWKTAGAQLGRIRPLITLNLALGVAVYAVALIGRGAG
jgi:uncharacterized membrane protein